MSDTTPPPQQEDTPEPPEYGGLNAGMRGGKWSWRARRRIALIMLFSLPVLPFQALLLKILPKLWWQIPLFWHRTMSRILGLRTTIIGKRPEGKSPVLYVANHISWVDIILLGGHLPKASFVAKADIAGWGMAAKIVDLHRTIYVERSRRSDSANQRDKLMDRLKEGASLIMFPESTSTDGIRMEPFKSSLFSVAEKGDKATHGELKIQPITISYPELDGMPLVRGKAHHVAWLGDIEIVSHVRAFLDQVRTRAIIEYHEPVTLAEFGNRKALAAHSETVIREGLQRHRRQEHHMGPQN